VRNDGNLPAEGVELLADLSTRAASYRRPEGRGQADAGRGRDRVDGGAGADNLYVADGAHDVVRGGAGEDWALADRVDRIVGVEHVVTGN
jgi:Ca2+-binding RTX toxin-like protein